MDLGASVSRRRWYLENFLSKDKNDKQKVFSTYQDLRKQADDGLSVCHYDFQFNQSQVQSHKDDLRNLYLLKQMGLITQTNLFLYKMVSKSIVLTLVPVNLICSVLWLELYLLQKWRML